MAAIKSHESSSCIWYYALQFPAMPVCTGAGRVVTVPGMGRLSLSKAMAQ